MFVGRCFCKLSDRGSATEGPAVRPTDFSNSEVPTLPKQKREGCPRSRF
jgi:hypothetical protein